MNTRREWLLASAVAALGSACAGQRGSAPEPVRVSPAIDWPLSPPDAHGLPGDALARVLAQGEAVPALRALVVVRNGALVAERYYGGASASDLLPINSVTKSISSMLVGQALQRGTLPGLQVPLRQLIPEALAQVPGSAAGHITLGQILSGHSGIVYDWRTDFGALAGSADPLKHVLALPVDPALAGRWTYNDAAVSLLSTILQRAEGLDLAELAQRDLFPPLGIDRFGWRRDRIGRPPAYVGLQLRTRDLAKLAAMMADGGLWQGQRVLPAPWVSGSTQALGPSDWHAPPIIETGYGQLWFTGRLHGQAVAWGWGYGGQFGLLAPALRLAVATAANPPPIDVLPAQTRAVMALVAQVVALAPPSPRPVQSHAAPGPRWPARSG